MSAVCPTADASRGPPEGDVAPHAHRVRAARPQPARPARHPARDHVRPDRHRLAHGERVHGDHPARDDVPRLLLRGRRAVHSARRRGARRRVDADLDAPILIRTAYLHDGRCACRSARPWCATPTRTARSARRTARPPACSGDRRRPALTDRPRSLRTRSTRTRLPPLPDRSPTIPRSRRCWPLATPGSPRSGSTPRTPSPPVVRSEALSAIVVDAEDRFTTMLAHQLRHLGLSVRIVPWSEVTDEQLAEAELVVRGRDRAIPAIPRAPRMRRMRDIVAGRRASGRPLLAVCLSHQILARTFGIDLAPLESPHQGLQKTVDVFGMPASIGFYNTFTARVAAGHDVGRRRRGGGRSGHRGRVRPARPGVRVGAGTPRVDPLARRDDDARAARRGRPLARRRLSPSPHASCAAHPSIRGARRNSTSSSSRTCGLGENAVTRRELARARPQRASGRAAGVARPRWRSVRARTGPRPSPRRRDPDRAASARGRRARGGSRSVPRSQGVDLVQRRLRPVDLGDGDGAVEPHDGRAGRTRASMS